jgi:hypothetical protein
MKLRVTGFSFDFTNGSRSHPEPNGAGGSQDSLGLENQRLQSPSLIASERDALYLLILQLRMDTCPKRRCMVNSS